MHLQVTTQTRHILRERYKYNMVMVKFGFIFMDLIKKRGSLEYAYIVIRAILARQTFKCIIFILLIIWKCIVLLFSRPDAEVCGPI